ncbi:YeiH family protein [Arthrobacter jinronghuae]|uniref:YeiH family protein n=1 Tax=Arthrobacter jinronghuae TaxID=2964609 RepID=UPI00387E4870
MPESPAASSPAPSSRWNRLRGTVPGLLTAAAAVVVSFLVHLLLPAVPVLTAAVVLGLLAANVPGSAAMAAGAWKPGLALAARKFLRLGIVLLGLKVSLVDIAGLGWTALLLIVALVLAAFAGTYGICRLFRLPGDEPVLIAAGFSICGVSAIGAMAAVRRTRTEETVVPVALVTLCGTLAIAVLPLAGRMLGLPAEVFGSWAGASVHDVGQVVATAQTAGTAALAAAVVVKLARVVLLAPMTAAAGLRARRAQLPLQGKRPPLVPLFVLGFLALILVRTWGVLPGAALETAAVLQELLFAAALFALGAGVRVRALFASGVRAAAAALTSWALISGLGLAAAVLLAG